LHKALGYETILGMARKTKARAVSVKLELRYEKRRNAVDAVRAGEPVAVVARILKVPHRTLFSWLARYRHGGYGALREGHRSGRGRKVSTEVMQWLYEAITLGEPRQYQLPFCLWTLGLVRQLLKRKFGIELSKSGVSRLLRHLGLSPQRPIYRSYKRDPEAMKKYLDQTFPGLRARARRTGAIIYFVDEAAVRSDAHRGTTWGKIGQTPEVADSGDRFSLRLISAVSPRGDMKFACFEGRMNGPRFVEFLKKLRADAGRPIIVIADKASYHTGGAQRRYVAESRGEVVVEHLPAYSPDLNPDEQVWNHAKARLAKRFVATKEEFKAALFSILLSIQRTPDLILSFFQLPGTSYAAHAV
jgi:transposase